MEREVNFQNAFYILLKVMGVYIEAERRTSNGRIGLFFRTDRYYYIVELKLDGTAEEALAQINDKNYTLPFATNNRKIVKIGVAFSSSTRTISSWIIEPVGR